MIRFVAALVGEALIGTAAIITAIGTIIAASLQARKAGRDAKDAQDVSGAAKEQTAANHDEIVLLAETIARQSGEIARLVAARYKCEARVAGLDYQIKQLQLLVQQQQGDGK